jgi:hypothetical protein
VPATAKPCIQHSKHDLFLNTTSAQQLQPWRASFTDIVSNTIIKSEANFCALSGLKQASAKNQKNHQKRIEP